MVARRCTYCTLQRHGIKDSALGSAAAEDRVPAWLEKWAALVLCFVEEESALLPPQLCGIPPPQAFYTPSSAVVEARGSIAARAVCKVPCKRSTMTDAAHVCACDD